MTFNSILFERPEDGGESTFRVPEFFVDLNIDQIVDAIISGKEEYNLRPFFLSPLKRVEAIKYRHEILQELEGTPALREALRLFARRMREMNRHMALADKNYFKYEWEGWFFNAVELYCEAINHLLEDLSALNPKSRGFSSFLGYLTGYAKSSQFTSLLEETKKLRADLTASKYCLVIKDDQFSVRKYEGEGDYSVEVEKTFEKFKQGAVKDYRATFPEFPHMNHIETTALDFVAKLYPEVFESLDRYCENHANYLDKTIASFDREMQFYVAGLDLVERLRVHGLGFCYPSVSDSIKQVRSVEGFDLALAIRSVREKSKVVCNDFYLKENERIFVVNGPNQGGKTTFARAFGQLHYLAALGLPVAGKEAQLFLFDKVFTHFEREEDIQDLRSRLEEDLVRIKSILDGCTPKSIVVINELFSSSTLQDATFLGKRVLDRMIELDMLGVYVTFIDELSTMEKTVSMLSSVSPEDPEVCTFKIQRRPADGLAYAMAVARKHQLTYDRIKERIRQ